MQTRFENPLLCLTASATLREKKVTQTPQRAPLIAVIERIIPVVPEEHDVVDSVVTVPPPQPDVLAGLPEADILAGLLRGELSRLTRMREAQPRSLD